MNEGDVYVCMCNVHYADVRNVHADHAASHVGKAQGLVTLVRSIHYHARRSNVYLPRDLMIKVKVDINLLLFTRYMYSDHIHMLAGYLLQI